MFLNFNRLKTNQVIIIWLTKKILELEIRIKCLYYLTIVPYFEIKTVVQREPKNKTEVDYQAFWGGL